ncbi:MAG TPA: hypothetical protein VEP90_21765 [Methylomirabilota bacterium]|nr:hypothetical protein [Methylomirabilota bacterium]
MADNHPTSPGQSRDNNTDSYGMTGNKVSTVGKMLMGPASKKNKRKFGKLASAKRFPIRMRKGM